jgi:hypothetical protein
MSKCNKREKKENSGIVFLFLFWVPPITPSSFRELSLLGGDDDEIG